MTWVASGIAVGSAALGAYSADKQRQQQANTNKQSAAITAAQTEFSPWTHLTPQAAHMGSNFGPGAAGGAAQGALGGAMFAKSNGMGGFGAGAAGAGPPPVDTSGGQLTPEEMMKMQKAGQSIRFK